jgi:hypothetical protein
MSQKEFLIVAAFAILLALIFLKKAKSAGAKQRVIVDIAAIVSAAVALVSAYEAGSQRQVEVSQQLDARYRDDCERLDASEGGAPKLLARMGAMRDLAFLAEKWTSYQPRVRGILVQYLRANAEKTGPPYELEDLVTEGCDHLDRLRTQPRADVAEAISTLGKLRRETPASCERTFLEGLNLHGADLREGDYRSISFVGSDLSSADLKDGEFQGADFSRSNLQGARLAGAHLEPLTSEPGGLTAMNETRAEHACFERTIVSGAKVKAAHFQGADLRSAIGLNREQLISARLDSTTMLPPSLAGDPSLAR